MDLSLSSLRLGASFGPTFGQRIASLVKKNNGALYDPSDLTSMRAGRDGSGGNPAADDVVGLVLDKSQMGGRTAANFIAGQTELITNGDFDADSDWTKGTGWSIGSGVATVTAGVSASLSASSNPGFTNGNWYEITFDINSISGGSLYVNIGNSVNGPTVSATGQYKTILKAAGNGSFSVITFGGTVTAEIDNVSIKRIPGNHLVAPSDAARPALRESGGLYYLEFDGVDDSFSAGNATDLNFGTGPWLAMAAIASNSGDGYDVFAGKGTSSSADNFRLFSHGFKPKLFWGADSGGGDATMSNAVTEAGLPTVWGWGRDASGDTLYRLNETTQTVSGGGGTGSNSLDFTIGWDGSFYRLEFDWYGAAFFGGELTTAEQALVKSYLYDKAGVTP